MKTTILILLVCLTYISYGQGDFKLSKIITTGDCQSIASFELCSDTTYSIKNDCDAKFEIAKLKNQDSKYSLTIELVSIIDDAEYIVNINDKKQTIDKTLNKKSVFKTNSYSENIYFTYNVIPDDSNNSSSEIKVTLSKID